MMTNTALEMGQFLDQHPEAHILQCPAWGELKAQFGWQVERVIAGDCGAQILFRSLLPGLRLAYIPKGPVGKAKDDFWREVDLLCRKHGCFMLKVESDQWEISQADDPNQEPITRPIPVPGGFQRSLHSIQPLRTLLVDLSGDERTVLGRMKQKTRYNINLALKKGVVVAPSTDIVTFHHLMQATGQRDQFGVHSLEYYRKAYNLFHPRGNCELLIAEFDHEPLGALMVFTRGKRAWYFYGASSDLHRDRMPNYLLQWEAMRWARSQGCTEYDLWGVPDANLTTLEKQFTERSDGLWGVYRFKRGFGGELRRAASAWDRVYNSLLYRFYCWQAQRKRQSE